ncbi:hypothetical protein BMS3Abin10_00301 [bacterium BMS3Abin10]|nr:hypothetical protein BMS3Abin10_00301 [bacterium BMS3Abin10]GBE39460.1 hypothetical protein BMS3Bbin08_02083 [bacterium BMS3Bbin08]
MKKNIKEPDIIFLSWEPWHMRDSTAQRDPDDPPPNFDVSGIYLFAHFKKKPRREKIKNDKLHLDPNVIYIGKSKRVTNRLEGKRHEKITKDYIEIFNDKALEKLYYSLCHTGWTTWDYRDGDYGKALNAGLLFFERKLIWEFAKKYRTIPILNRQ